MATAQAAAAGLADSRAIERPAGSVRFDLVAALAFMWSMVGAHLDAWAHTHLPGTLETFFTPWHAVLYSGLLVMAAVIGFKLMQGVREGYSWWRALPAGYEITLIGLALFGLTGALDGLWHTYIGIELRVDAMFSPPHQLGAVAFMLVSAGPLRAAWVRAGSTLSNWTNALPIVLSMAQMIATFTLIGLLTHPLAQPWPASILRTDGYDQLTAIQVASVGGVMIHTAFTMGLILLAVKRWGCSVAPGAFTLMFALNAVGVAVLKDQFQLIPAMLLAGVAADVLMLLWPGEGHVWRTRIYAAAVPLVMYAAYFTIFALTDTVWWSNHAITGIVTAAGLTGVLVSFLVFPPAMPQPALDSD